MSIIERGAPNNDERIESDKTPLTPESREAQKEKALKNLNKFAQAGLLHTILYRKNSADGFWADERTLGWMLPASEGARALHDNSYPFLLIKADDSLSVSVHYVDNGHLFNRGGTTIVGANGEAAPEDIHKDDKLLTSEILAHRLTPDMPDHQEIIGQHRRYAIELAEKRLARIRASVDSNSADSTADLAAINLE